MEHRYIDLVLDNPDVEELASQPAISPTFEIINGEDRSYPCDPSAAVDSAHLVFEAFSAARVIGFVQINVRDDGDAAAAIPHFLHGRPLHITVSTAQIYIDLALALGIPLIAKYARKLMPSSVILDGFENPAELLYPADGLDDGEAPGAREPD
jgi:hypothetical protein